MRHKVLVVYSQKCTGCRICEQWCSWSHHTVVNPARSRIAIHRLHHRYVNVPVACSQCTRAPCIDVCPEGSISRDPETFGLILDQETCIGCRLCLERKLSSRLYQGGRRNRHAVAMRLVRR